MRHEWDAPPGCQFLISFMILVGGVALFLYGGVRSPIRWSAMGIIAVVCAYQLWVYLKRRQRR